MALTSVSSNTTFAIDNDLTDLLVQNFNTEDQKLFVQSFRMYLEHGDDDTKFVISLDDIWEWLGYKKIQDVRNLLIKHFSENTHYVLLTPERKQNINTEHRGGHNKQLIMLNVNTFKKLCMKASTSRANDICDYYVKMENIMHRYMRHKLFETQKIQIQYQQELDNNHNKIAMGRHHYLVKTYRDKKAVYVMRMQSFNNGSYVIKIGKTNNIKERLEKLTAEYRCKPVITDIYESENPEKFETFLHRHSDIVKRKYTGVVNDTKASTECYLIKNDREYKAVIALMEKHQHQFQTDKDLLRLQIERENQVLERERLALARELVSMSVGEKVLTCMAINQVSNLFVTSPNLSTDNSFDSEDEPEETDASVVQNDDCCGHCGQKKPIVKLPVVKKSQYQGPYVQMYDKDDITKLVRVFDNKMDLIREFKELNHTQLKYVVRHRLVYLDHRWNFVNRVDDPNKAYDIGQTARTHTNNTDMVCMLDKDRTRIEKVFCLQKEAANEIGQHPSAMCSSIRYGSLLSDKYWMVWSAMSKEMQDAYLENNTLPNRSVVKRGTRVQQLHPETREVIATFDSFSDAVKNVKTSTKSIKKAVTKNVVCSGFRWRVI